MSSTHAQCRIGMRVRARVLNARREIRRAFHQHRARRSLALERSLRPAAARECSPPRASSFRSSAPAIRAALFVEQTVCCGALAFEHRDGHRSQLGVQTQQRLRGKLRGINAGVECVVHARFFARLQASSAPKYVPAELRLALFSASHAPRADHVDTGGLRRPARNLDKMGTGSVNVTGLA